MAIYRSSIFGEGQADDVFHQDGADGSITRALLLSHAVAATARGGDGLRYLCDAETLRACMDSFSHAGELLSAYQRTLSLLLAAANPRELRDCDLQMVGWLMHFLVTMHEEAADKLRDMRYSMEALGDGAALEGGQHGNE